MILENIKTNWVMWSAILDETIRAVAIPVNACPSRGIQVI